MVRRIANERKDWPAPELAMTSYALLFAAIFFFGATALVAVVIAYAQRGQAQGHIRSHYDFQIRIFWVAFVLALLAGGTGLAGLVAGLGEVMASTSISLLGPDDGLQIDMSQARLDRPVLLLLGASLLFTGASILWLMIAPTLGFIRLASARPMGDSPPR